ncbi:MAG: hypothetical protein U9M90_02845 [Patescibacteria group bacterium]|nr:hypothetical protein [Patescibacteria group bacterium]
MKLVLISGLDGSGKSTQIELLKNYLESRGKRVFYFHAVEFSIGNAYKIFSKKRRKLKTADKKAPSITKENQLQIQLRKIALRIDIWRFKRLMKKLEKQGYDYILSDRFFYDSAINIEYLSNLSPFRKGRVGEGFLNRARNIKSPLIPIFQRGKPKIQNSLSVYLQTSPRNIMNRDHVPDQGLEYLEKKKELYDAKTKVWNWKIIDGNRSKEEIFEEMKLVLERISDPVR